MDEQPVLDLYQNPLQPVEASTEAKILDAFVAFCCTNPTESYERQQAADHLAGIPTPKLHSVLHTAGVSAAVRDLILDGDWASCKIVTLGLIGNSSLPFIKRLREKIEQCIEEGEPDINFMGSMAFASVSLPYYHPDSGNDENATSGASKREWVFDGDGFTFPTSSDKFNIDDYVQDDHAGATQAGLHTIPSLHSHPSSGASTIPTPTILPISPPTMAPNKGKAPQAPPPMPRSTPLSTKASSSEVAATVVQGALDDAMSRVRSSPPPLRSTSHMGLLRPQLESMVSSGTMKNFLINYFEQLQKGNPSTSVPTDGKQKLVDSVTQTLGGRTLLTYFTTGDYETESVTRQGLNVVKSLYATNPDAFHSIFASIFVEVVATSTTAGGPETGAAAQILAGAQRKFVDVLIQEFICSAVDDVKLTVSDLELKHLDYVIAAVFKSNVLGGFVWDGMPPDELRTNLLRFVSCMGDLHRVQRQDQQGTIDPLSLEATGQVPDLADTAYLLKLLDNILSDPAQAAKYDKLQDGVISFAIDSRKKSWFFVSLFTSRLLLRSSSSWVDTLEEASPGISSAFLQYADTNPKTIMQFVLVGPIANLGAVIYCAAALGKTRLTAQEVRSHKGAWAIRRFRALFAERMLKDFFDDPKFKAEADTVLQRIKLLLQQKATQSRGKSSLDMTQLKDVLEGRGGVNIFCSYQGRDGNGHRRTLSGAPAPLPLANTSLDSSRTAQHWGELDKAMAGTFEEVKSGSGTHAKRGNWFSSLRERQARAS